MNPTTEASPSRTRPGLITKDDLRTQLEECRNGCWTRQKGSMAPTPSPGG